MRGKRRTWTDEALIEAVAKHANFTDVLRELGLRPAGGNHASMKRNAVWLGLDTSHFNSERRVRGLTVARELQRRSDAEIFCEGSRVSRPALRSRARLRISPLLCAKCGNDGEWLGQHLTLQLDHANGRYDDNRLENLRWLCPNCDSQTPTFAGRGTSRRVREAPAFYAACARSRRPAPRRSFTC